MYQGTSINDVACREAQSAKCIFWVPATRVVRFRQAKVESSPQNHRCQMLESSRLQMVRKSSTAVNAGETPCYQIVQYLPQSQICKVIPTWNVPQAPLKR